MRYSPLKRLVCSVTRLNLILHFRGGSIRSQGEYHCRDGVCLDVRPLQITVISRPAAPIPG